MTSQAGFFKRYELRLGSLLAVSVASALPSSAEDYFAPPLPMNNRTPFTQVLVAPTAPNYTLPVRGSQFGMHLDLSSHSVIQTENDAQVELDGETLRLTFDAQHRFARRWLARMELPVTLHGGGFLDRSIDSWHSLTGLPEGERPRQPRNQLLIGYLDADNFSLTNTQQSSLGDLQISLAYEVFASGNTGSQPSQAATNPWKSTAWTQLTVKVPTGDSESLTGSGAVDVAASWHYHREQNRTQRPWALSVDAYAMRTGTGKVLSIQEDLHWQLGLKLARQWHQWLVPEAQLRYRSAAYSSAVDAIGGSSLGVDLGLVIKRSGHYWRLGLSEDLNVDSAPDVGFYVQYHRQRAQP